VKPPGSLRARVILGTCLWTLGLFVIFSIVLTQALFRHPAVPGVFHRLFLHVAPLSILAVACLAFGLYHVRRGLGSFGDLRTRLAALRGGRDRRLDGPFPAEVQPLVGELNGLLADREQRVARALTTAGDLAHGLKTPLAVLNHVACRARDLDRPDLAEAITQQVDRMRRQVDYHLAQARASAAGGRADARASLVTSADGLVRTMQTVHAERGVTLAVDMADALDVAVDRHDLDEMLGNVLDNACKWARARVHVHAVDGDTAATRRVTVDDDGPGIAPELRAAVLRRGVRADEAAPGSGLGLAIVRDLVDLYGGALTLSASPLGGLRVELTLPAAPRA
jgi:signal transduction histidine kinase